MKDTKGRTVELTFDTLGQAMGFMFKLQKHIGNDNCGRIKDYVTRAFDGYNPENYKCHPCIDTIREGVKVLKSHGWKVGICYFDDIGIQFTCISPDNEWYRSHFKH